MNDYKELVFNLMFLAKYCHSEYNDLCVDDELKKAADAIEQLVKERDELTTKCCRLEQERDAAVADLKEAILGDVGECFACKHRNDVGCGAYSDGECWEWRGVQENNDEAD